jgi:hypothetical protein
MSRGADHEAPLCATARLPEPAAMQNVAVGQETERKCQLDRVRPGSRALARPAWCTRRPACRLGAIVLCFMACHEGEYRLQLMP